MGVTDLTEATLDQLAEMAFATCTLCRRCVVNCPMGVDTPYLVRAARALATAAGRAPQMLEELAGAAIAKGESLDLFKDLFAEQVAEMEKDLQGQVGDPQARIPIDKQGAQVLYVALSGAHTIMPAALLFYATGTDWTLSPFEAANYAYFLADPSRAKVITKRIVDEATRLGVKEVVVTECGHAYAVLRWEAPNWFETPFAFQVRSLVEVMAQWITEGSIELDPSRNTDPVTYHDSCNLARNGGIIEEPRTILRAAVSDFIEMTPNRENAYCCGGGAGLVAVPEWTDRRLAAGKPKADQIRRTGAKLVAASCDNCRLQLDDLGEHYQLGTTVVGLADLVARALVLPSRGPDHRPDAGPQDLP